MANAIRYSTTGDTQSLKKGNFFFGVGDVGKGPSSATTYYNGSTPSASGYTVYSFDASQPSRISYASPTSDSEFISITNVKSGQNFTGVTQCLNWYATQTDHVSVNKDYEPIVSNGLVLNVDASYTPSYTSSGTTWYDLAYSGNNGILTNGPTYSSANGGSIVFDGVDDYIEFGDVLDLGTNSLTVNHWLNLTLYSSQVFMSKALSNAQNYRFATGIGFPTATNGKLYAFMQGNGGADIVPYGTTAVPLNTWFMATYVFDRPSSIKIYYNGMQETLTGDTIISQWNGLNFQSINPFRLATYTTANNTGIIAPMNGKMGITQVYFRSLSASEILQNYQATFPRFLGENIVTNGLVLYLDAGYSTSYPTTGTTWNNVSGVSGGTGTLTNGPTYSSANGGSILFDGIDDYVTGSTLVTPSFSVNFWFKPLLVRDYNPVFYINNWGDFIWHTTSNGSIYCGTDVNTRFTPSSNGCGAGSVSLNTIQNFTYTFNSGTGSLYKNGTLLVSSNSQLTPSSSGTIKQYGMSGLGNNGNFNSYIFQIYNRALTATEVLQNFNAQKSRFGL